MSAGKNIAEGYTVGAGAAVGSVAGGTVVSAATAQVAATAAATAASASNSAVFIAAGFPIQAQVYNPALWAALAANPIGGTAIVFGGAALGAIACYKLVKRIL